MRAIVYTGAPKLELSEVPEPRELVGEVIIDVAAVGICGSELHAVAHPDGFRTPPLVMGHEIIGRRRDTGELVAVNPLVACGSCDRCALGRTNLCRSREIIGIHRPGGYSERVSVPLGNVHHIPVGIATDEAVLVEPLVVAVHAWALTPHSDEDRVAIIGAGPIGLLFLVLAVARAARAIAVVDLSASRQQMAAALGAGRTASSLDGEFDLIVDAVGCAATRRASLDHLGPGGTAVWLGLQEADTAVDGQALVRAERRVFGSFCYTDDEFRTALDLLPEVRGKHLVTSVRLSDGISMFAELLKGRTDVAKVMMVPA